MRAELQVVESALLLEQALAHLLRALNARAEAGGGVARA